MITTTTAISTLGVMKSFGPTGIRASEIATKNGSVIEIDFVLIT
jgi:hypothetical protein